eukprot:UN07245
MISVSEDFSRIFFSKVHKCIDVHTKGVFFTSNSRGWLEQIIIQTTVRDVLDKLNAEASDILCDAFGSTNICDEILQFVPILDMSDLKIRCSMNHGGNWSFKLVFQLDRSRACECNFRKGSNVVSENFSCEMYD